MWRHSVMGHRPPGMISGCRLRKPYVTGVPGELSAFECSHDGISIADLSPGGVDDVSTPFHRRDELVVEEMLGLGVQRSVDRDDVAMRHHRRRALVEAETELALDLSRQAVAIRVMKLDVERLQPPQDGKADASSGHRPNRHALEVVGPFDTVGDIPTPVGCFSD